MARPYHYAIDSKAVIAKLNQILESELAGTVRYTHYSLMVFGFSRIPVVGWFREQAQETLLHAQQAGELVTHLGGHPSLGIGTLLESHQHDMSAILRETLECEHDTLKLYFELLQLVEGKAVPLEEYARDMIRQEEMHLDEIDKMLRKPGDIAVSPVTKEVTNQ